MTTHKHYDHVAFIIARVLTMKSSQFDWLPMSSLAWKSELLCTVHRINNNNKIMICCLITEGLVGWFDRSMRLIDLSIKLMCTYR